MPAPRLKAIAVAAMAGLAAAAWSEAMADEALKAAVSQAINTNPEVTARLHALKGAGALVDVARAPYLPRVDLDADAGRNRDRFDNRSPRSQQLDRAGVGLTVTQLLWDGLATQRDVQRANRFAALRHFEFIDTTEQTALEAARAHYDVLRHRRLLALADENYVMHRVFNAQIDSRVRAGVARGVDLEQVGARLALAESNRLTEIANLHDVMARHRRVVGTAPANPVATAPERSLDRSLSGGLPATPAELQASAVAGSASLGAAVENLRVARAQAQTQKASWQPRVELRGNVGGGRNYDGLLAQRSDATVEVVLNWNLYSGGADSARALSLASALLQAEDTRDRICTEVAQTAAIAHHDVGKLNQQVPLLQRNVETMTRARDAYRQQFEIGQRTLLDLLNTENELYTARRALANAEHDLRIAWARSHAVASRLTSALGLVRLDAGAAPAADDGADTQARRCPLGELQPAVVPQAELDARARAIADSRPAAPGAAGTPAATGERVPAPSQPPARQRP